MKGDSDPNTTMVLDPCPGPAVLEAIASGESDDAVLIAHVGACDSCRGVIADIRENNRFLSDFATELRPPPDLFEEASVPSEIIPGYRLLSEIHRGAQGIVYKAEQEHTRRIVAVKMLLQGAFATPRQRSRFEREAEIAAGLRHPNIVTVYDSTPVRGNRFALIMEHIEGVPLDVRGLRPAKSGGADGRRAIAPVIEMFAKVCDAVQYAHQRGVIHRDLKPGNILVDSAGEPHVLDFGIAKIRAGSDFAELRIGRPTETQPGEFAGTLAYASPEQVAGRPDLIDTRTDVYALGVILYELLTGAMPYPVDGSFGEVIRNVAELMAGRPSALNPDVDDDLDTIVLRALDKDPARRYQSAQQLRDDLIHWLKGEPIAAKRDSLWYVLRKTVKRRKGAAAAAAVVTVALVLGIVGVTTAVNQQAERVKQQAAKEFMRRMLSSVNPAMTQGASVSKFMLQQAEDELAHGVLDGQPEVEAEVRMTLALAYRQMGMAAQAAEHARIAYEIRLNTLGEKHLDTAASQCEYGLLMAFGHVDRREQTEGLIRRSLATREDLSGKESLAYAHSAYSLGCLLVSFNEYDRALPWLEHALRVRRARLGETHADTAACTTYYATALWLSDPANNADEAERILRESIASFRPEGSAPHPVLGDSLSVLADVVNSRLRFDESIELFERTLELRRRLYDPDNPLIGVTMTSLGTVYLIVGQREEAGRMLSGAADIFRKWLPESSAQLAHALMYQGQLKMVEGDFPEAESLLLEAYAHAVNTDRGDLRTLRSLASIIIPMYEAWGRPDSAQGWRERLAEHGLGEDETSP